MVHVNYELNERDIPEAAVVRIHGIHSTPLLQAAKGCAVVNALQELTQDGCLLMGIVIRNVAMNNTYKHSKMGVIDHAQQAWQALCMHLLMSMMCE